MNIKRFLIQFNMIELGIIPAVTKHELYIMLESLNDEEKIKLNRKFRKVWRKIAKADPDAAKYLGLGKKNPGAYYIKRRNSIVVYRIGELINAAIKVDQSPAPLQPW